MSLLGLSNEILQQIIGYVAAGWLPLHDPHNRRRLINISKCCWRLHNIVHPYLYSALEIHQWEGYKFLSFIRTLTAKPQLARLVKTFYYTEIIGDESEISSLLEESKAWMRSILPDETYGIEACDEWFNDLFLGSIGDDKSGDAIVAWLLVLFSDNLEEFSFNDFEGERPYIDSVLEDAAEEQWLDRSPCPLSSLKSVHVYPYEFEEKDCRVGFDSILPFLKLKSVEELSVSDLDMGYMSARGWGPDNDNKFKLRALTLNCSRLNEFTLPQFLICFSSLTKFDYQVWKGTDQYTRNWCIWPVLRRSLFNLRGCLEELYLESETNDDVELDARYSHAIVGDTHQPFGLLSEFSNLRIIAMDANILIGTERGSSIEPEGWHYTREQCSSFAWSLPTSLEHLSIMDGSRALFDSLSILFTSDRRMALPNLKSISISFRGGDLYGSAAWQELAKVASERGIELKKLRSKE